MKLRDFGLLTDENLDRADNDDKQQFERQYEISKQSERAGKYDRADQKEVINR